MIKNQISLHELRVAHQVLDGIVENYEYDIEHLEDTHRIAIEILQMARNLVAAEASIIHGDALTRKFIK